MLVACLAAAACVYPISRNIQYDHSVRALFASDNPRLLTYESVVEDFRADAICLAVYTDPQLLSPEGMARLRDFTLQLRQVDGVLEASSLAEMRRPSLAYLPRSLAEWFQTPGVDRDALRGEVLGCDMYVDQFIGSDGETAAVMLLLDREAMATGKIEETLAKLRELAAAHPQQARVVGTPVMISDTYAYLDQDSWVLTYVSSIAMMLVILVLFWNVRWMILPILIVQITLVWTQATMVACDAQLSIIGSMTTALITVIGIATAIHLAVRFREESSLCASPAIALEQTLMKVAPAIFWTSATTAAGFGSLAVSRVTPVRSFAVIMGAASMYVAVACFMLVPGGALISRLRPAPRTTPGGDKLAIALGGLVRFVTRHTIITALATALLLGFAGAGFQWLKVETDFTRNFREDSPLLEGYRFVETRLGGAGLIDLVFDTPDRLDPAFLDKVRSAEEQLRQIPGVTKVTGLTDFLDFIDESVPSQASSLTAFLPKGPSLEARISLLRALTPRLLDSFWNRDKERMRVVLRVREQQTVSGKNELLESIESTARATLGDSASVTGLYVLLVYLIDSLLADQWLSFGVSCVAILAMAAVAFRSLRLGFVAFVPNLVPITIVLGAMGWLGLSINVATAMIGSISMGLVVDFSIHYLNRFRQELKGGADFYTALWRTHRSTGQAMVFANLALTLGFCVLVFSNFVPTIHFGLLVSIAILGGLVGNLVLLPVLLRLVYWVGRPKDSDMRPEGDGLLEDAMRLDETQPAVVER